MKPGLSNGLDFALCRRPQKTVFVRAMTVCGSGGGLALPRGQVVGIEAGGGAASAQKRKRQGG